MVAQNTVRTYGVDQVFDFFVGYIERVVKSNFIRKIPVSRVLSDTNSHLIHLIQK